MAIFWEGVGSVICDFLEFYWKCRSKTSWNIIILNILWNNAKTSKKIDKKFFLRSDGTYTSATQTDHSQIVPKKTEISAKNVHCLTKNASIFMFGVLLQQMKPWYWFAIDFEYIGKLYDVTEKPKVVHGISTRAMSKSWRKLHGRPSARNFFLIYNIFIFVTWIIFKHYHGAILWYMSHYIDHH